MTDGGWCSGIHFGYRERTSVASHSHRFGLGDCAEYAWNVSRACLSRPNNTVISIREVAPPIEPHHAYKRDGKTEAASSQPCFVAINIERKNARRIPIEAG